MQPTHIDLFSGIGGFALAAQWAGFRTVCFVEIDKYCQKVLAKNFLAGASGTGGRRGNESIGTREETSFGSPQIHTNIFDFDGTRYRGCDLLTGGFPCQPFSLAGKRRGTADDRAIWPEMFRVIAQARPAWVLGENVPGIIPMELDNVLSDLESIGYACRPFVIPACAVDARHRRDRLWIIGRRTLADASCERLEGWQETIRPQEGRNGNARHDWAQVGSNGGNCEWLPEPNVGRVANGIPSRVDRLKGLGNAIVPQVSYEILREIRKLI